MQIVLKFTIRTELHPPHNADHGRGVGLQPLGQRAHAEQNESARMLESGTIISCRLELNNPSRAAKLNGAVERDVAFRRSGISRMKHVGNRSLCQYADEQCWRISLRTRRP